MIRKIGEAILCALILFFGFAVLLIAMMELSQAFERKIPRIRRKTAGFCLDVNRQWIPGCKGDYIPRPKRTPRS